MHVRTTIRAAVKTILEASAPAEWTIRKGRGRPQTLDEIKVGGVAIIAIPREAAQRGAERKRRDPVLSVTAYLARSTDGEDAADDAAEWIEAALDADATLGGTVADSVHASTDIDIHTGGETPVWELTLTYQLRVS